MHIGRKPGELLEVDWAGQTAEITDTDTGEPFLHIFSWHPCRTAATLMLRLFCHKTWKAGYQLMLMPTASSAAQRGYLCPTT